MTIKLDFSLSPSWRAWEGLDLAAANESVLRFDAFLGDVLFQVGDLDVSARWGWVPLLDFAASLLHVVASLESGSAESVLDFTESDDEIRFRKGPDEQIEVRSTYTDGGAEASLGELRAAAEGFARSLLSRLCERWPALKQNSELTRWYPGL